MEATEVLEAVPEHHHRHGRAETTEEKEGPFRQRASIAAGLFAIILAITHLGGADQSKRGLMLSIKANDTWAWSQAKGARMHDAQNFATTMATLLEASPSISQALRNRATSEIAKAEEDARRYESDPSSGQGRQELARTAAKLEAARDKAFEHQDVFEFAETLLQVAVVLSGLSAVALSRTLLGIATGFGLLGALLAIDGFFLGVPLPW